MEETVSISCIIVLGDQPVDIEWLFNEYSLSAYSGVTVVKGGKRSSMLTIDSVQARHAGRYTCRASNRAASVNSTATLVVNGSLFKSVLKFNLNSLR